MFNRIDSWESDWNFLSATKAQRYAAAIEVGISCFLWIAKGFDSGIGEYGVSLHFSVFVVYGIEYALLNWWLDTKHQIKGIRNLIVSCLITIGSVACFEVYWGVGYSYFHGEIWVLTPLNNVYTELIIISLMGFLGLLYAIRLGIKLKVDRLTCFLLIPAAFWYFSGFNQTCFPAVDGSVVYIENNWVHLLNTLSKLGMSLACARTLLT